jgi:hypothetical protein
MQQGVEICIQISTPGVLVQLFGYTQGAAAGSAGGSPAFSAQRASRPRSRQVGANFQQVLLATLRGLA